MSDHHDDLQYERAVNERYMHEVNRLVADDQAVAREITAQQRNGQWLGTSLTLGSGPLVKPLHGRVALDLDDPVLGRSFYIGSYRADFDGTAVISYAAPMANLFYNPNHPDLDLGGHVLATRTFTSDTRSLTEFEDDRIRHDVDEPFGRADSAVVVERAPKPVVRPSRPVGRASADAPSPPVKPPASIEQAEQTLQTPASMEGPGAQPVRRLARAANTVLAAVRAPRTGRLSTLLSTLQPDQYELVTWPEEEHLVVQGHPGTGKTVIAAHRAAWLTDPERLERGRRAPKGSVLVIGPTAEYGEHIVPVLTDIARPGWEVTSLSAFYARLGGFAPAIRPPVTERLATSADPLGIFVLECHRRYSGPPDLSSFATALFGGRWTSDDPEVDALLRAARTVRHAERTPEFHPLLALASLSANGVALAGEVRHIIVDEAQDLRPIDVLILRQLVEHGVTLTLVGDMNQRHSDYTYDSWQTLAAAAHMESEIDMFRTVDIGYRSTTQILRFAAGLLPAAQRVSVALRDGPEPVVVKVTEGALADEAISRAVALREHLEGLVAIIGVDAKLVEDRLRSRRWGRGHSRHSWRASATSREILVLDPSIARGLEFDGVVVVEPASFPVDLGRNGVLYTSLTRATHELVVVHAKPLPKGLKAR
jgi:DNA helicase-2/ATP-dependent DNA helicase PcrA